MRAGIVSQRVGNIGGVNSSPGLFVSVRCLDTKALKSELPRGVDLYRQGASSTSQANSQVGECYLTGLTASSSHFKASISHFKALIGKVSSLALYLEGLVLTNKPGLDCKGLCAGVVGIEVLLRWMWL